MSIAVDLVLATRPKASTGIERYALNLFEALGSIAPDTIGFVDDASSLPPAPNLIRVKGGFKGWIGVAEEVSDISLACRQIGPIHFKDKMEQGGDMFRQRRSLFFKKMQIVRGCDAKRNVLVYMVYSDKLIEGSPKNSTSSVPVMPWAGEPPQKCSDFVTD